MCGGDPYVIDVGCSGGDCAEVTLTSVMSVAVEVVVCELGNTSATSGCSGGGCVGGGCLLFSIN